MKQSNYKKENKSQTRLIQLKIWPCLKTYTVESC